MINKLMHQANINNMTTKITWQDGVPFSPEFGDIYFSKESGLAETNHVFLSGNNLPTRWQNRQNFTIIETGFGTGLNFFATWKLWQETAAPKAVLNYISIEKYPLTADEIRKAISLWPELDVYVEEFCSHYTNKSALQNHKLNDGRINLTLIFDDVATALPHLQTAADAWFLDGFAPAKNPQMWNDDLYKEMARLTSNEGTFATFTAAGAVRRGLHAHGFSVEKVAGFGMKRHILTGKKIPR
jgi:tRNA 5-methylaminomethyl-2-thiouridine biosynthesis bifunctional protein